MKDYTKGVRLPRREYTEEEKMKARSRKLAKIIKYAQFMSEHNMPFTLSACNGKYQITSEHINDKMYERGDWLIPPILGFINKLGAYVKNNAISARFTQQYFESDVIYMEALKRPAGTVIYDLVEIDIDAAYWTTAYQLGAISPELYFLEGLEEKIEEFKQNNPWLKEETDKLLKRARLIALGSLAKKTIHYEFKGKQLIKSYTERKLETENIWFTVCKRVSDVMIEVMNTVGDNCIFFWVDGIYVKNDRSVIEVTENIFKKYGYKCKRKSIDRIEYAANTFSVYETIQNTEEPKKRVFNYVDKNTKRSRTIDPELLDYCLNGMNDEMDLNI